MNEYAHRPEEQSAAYGTRPEGAGPIPPGVVRPLERTRGWVLFLSIMGFIGAGITILYGVVLGGIGLAGGSWPALGDEKLNAPPFLIAMAVYMLIIGALYLFGATKLYQYAARIKQLVQAPSLGVLEDALDRQRAFWKFVGILTIVSMAAIPVLTAIAIVAVLTSGLSPA